MSAKAAARDAITRTAVFGLAAAVLGSALYWGVSAYRKAQLQRSVTVLVRDSSERLQAALALDTDAAGASVAQTVAGLDEQAQEVDRHVIELRDMNASHSRALLAAARTTCSRCARS